MLTVKALRLARNGLAVQNFSFLFFFFFYFLGSQLSTSTTSWVPSACLLAQCLPDMK